MAVHPHFPQSAVPDADAWSFPKLDTIGGIRVKVGRTAWQIPS